MLADQSLQETGSTMKQFESVSGVKMTSAVCAALMAVASATLALESPPVDLIYEEVLVTGGADGVRQVSGSARSS